MQKTHDGFHRGGQRLGGNRQGMKKTEVIFSAMAGKSSQGMEDSPASQRPNQE
jgi:hypothetical protein